MSIFNIPVLIVALAFSLGQERGIIKTKVEQKATQCIQAMQARKSCPDRLYEKLICFFSGETSSAEHIQETLLAVAQRETSLPFAGLVAQQCPEKYLVYLNKASGVEAGIRNALRKKRRREKQNATQP